MSSKVICVSENVKQSLKNSGVKEEKLITIHTGIDTKKYYAEKPKILREELGVSNQTLIVGIVAVMRKAKRHLDLIKAVSSMKNFKEIHLVIIGDGPQRKNIEQFIHEKNLQNKVSLLGNRRDIANILPSLDIFVLPSEMEALGTSILEASASGVPIIASKVGGIPECVIDKKTGLLFKPRDIVTLKNHLELLSMDKILRKDFGLEGSKHIIKNFSVDVMVAKTENLYNALVEK